MSGILAPNLVRCSVTGAARSAAVNGCLALALVANAIGCAATPKDLKLLGETTPLAAGQYVDQVLVDAAHIRTANYAALELGDIDTSAIRDQDGMTKAEAAAALRASVVTGANGQVLSLSGSGSKARLVLAITELDPGETLPRILFSWLGAGHAYVQVEGRVIDEATQTVLVQIADRRRGTGALGMRDLVGSSGVSMLRSMLAESGADLHRELSLLFTK